MTREQTPNRARDLETALDISEWEKIEELLERGCFEAAAEIASRPASTPVSAEHLERICKGLWEASTDAACDALLCRVFEARPGWAAILVLERRRFLRGDLDGVEHAIRMGLARFPDEVSLLSDLAKLLRDRRRDAESESTFRRILTLDPSNSDARAAVAAVDAQDGRLEEALSSLRDIERQTPLLVTPTIVGLMLYSATTTDEALFEEHLKRGRQLANRIERLTPKARQSRPARLKIGYVSADFREHSVSHFIEPALRHHDRDRFEVHAYHTRSGSDETTLRLAGLADTFDDVSNLDDRALAKRILDDSIDVLVDLGGHTQHSRVAVFAWKPAPVQMSYLGYPATTGLSAIDFRLTDMKADPPGRSDELHSERLIRLPRSAWCYEPPHSSPPVEKRRSKIITFGSFNALIKVTPEVVETWAAILHRVEGSRLLLKSRSFARPAAVGWCSKAFAEAGIGSERLTLRPWQQEAFSHLAAYSDVDVALDPFPYNGTTTTCEALWMGVPVVTLAGNRHAGRVGASLLDSVGHSELIARTRDEYVDIACALASDERRRKHLRASLRSEVHSSVLCDDRAFVRDLERAYDEGFSQHLEESRGPGADDAGFARLVARAREANERDLFETAAFLTGRALRVEPTNLELAMIAGRANEELGELDAAVQVVTLATEEQLRLLGEQAGSSPLAASLETRLQNESPLLSALVAELARICGRLGDGPGQARALSAGVRLSPRSAEARVDWATFLASSGSAAAALEEIRVALALSPNHPRATMLLGVVELSVGRAELAIEAFSKVSAGGTLAATAFSNLLYAHQHVEGSREEDFRRHLTFGVRHATARPLGLVGRKSKSAKLSIGYLSADFREQPVGRFIEPILRNHDRSQFEVTLYASVAQPDLVTERLARSVDRIVLVHDQDDESLASRIASDAIDIVIELGGHTARSRLRALSRRPAPVLASYLGYPNTTGMPTIDYRLTDGVVDPAGVADELSVERLVRLPGSAWCFQPRRDARPIVTRPRNGPLVFGSCNDFARLNDGVLDAWTGILAKLPDSRLLLVDRLASDAAVVGRVREAMARGGIESGRVELRDRSADVGAQLKDFDDIDIALDPFPYCGAISTCDSLDMGVPVITLTGERHVSRVGASLLAQVGLSEWVAPTVREYIDTAVRLGADRERLEMLRGGLRERLRGSPLCDAVQFTRALEEAYRQMWRARLATAPDHELPPTEPMPVVDSRQKRAAVLVDEATALLRSQQLELAEVVSRHAKATNPGSPETHNILGNVLVAKGDERGAEIEYRAALAVAPTFYKAYTNIGNLFSKRGDKRGAIEMLERSIALEPDAFRAYSSLAGAQRDLGLHDAAIASYERSLALESNIPASLGLVELLSSLGRFDDADATLEKALAAAPGEPRLEAARKKLEARVTVTDEERRIEARASALRKARESFRSGHAADAAATLQDQVLPGATGGELAEALDLLWRAHLDSGDSERAWEAFRRSLVDGEAQRTCARATLLAVQDERRLTKLLEATASAHPERSDLTYVYASRLVSIGQVGAAERLLREAPTDQRVELSLLHGMSLLLQGRQAEAISRMREKPVGDDLLLTLHYTDQTTRSEMLLEHVTWGKRAEVPRLPKAPMPDRRGRKLRIGYVSGDFFHHSVGRLIAPAITEYDRSKFEVFAYMTNPRSDALTGHVTEMVTGSRQAWALDDDALALAIRRDKIDILVDLSGHTAFNRLDCFARKPAPIQITYLGYPDTTGLDAMDYRITDADADPPGAEPTCVETLLRLPRTAWCYAPGSVPSVPPRPLEGPVVFGCFNTTAKITPEVIRCWAKIIQRSNSRLMLKALEFGEEGAAANWRARFVEAGLDGSRVDFLSFERDGKEHLRKYGDIDIALDPFPYNGTMTTCETLGMGVPLVSLVGERHASRVGLSLLSSVGLRELAATDLESYEELAVRLATDHAYRNRLRKTLSEQFRSSPLVDAIGFTRALEALYEEAWRRGPRS